MFPEACLPTWLSPWIQAVYAVIYDHIERSEEAMGCQYGFVVVTNIETLSILPGFNFSRILGFTVFKDFLILGIIPCPRAVKDSSGLN